MKSKATVKYMNCMSVKKMNENETVSDLRLELKWNIDTLLKAFVSWAPEGKTCFLVFYCKSCPSQFHALLVFTWIEPFLQTFVGYKETLLLLKFHDTWQKALIKIYKNESRTEISHHPILEYWLSLLFLLKHCGEKYQLICIYN